MVDVDRYLDSRKRQEHSAELQRLINEEKSRILILILAVLSFLLFAYTFYPGVLTSDSYFQYLQVATLRFDDWHPPAMAAVWVITDKVLKGSAGIFLLHVFLAECSIYFLSRVAAIKNKKFYLLPLVGIFLPVTSAILYAIWKDIAMSVSLLFAFSLWYFWRTNGVFKRWQLAIVIAITFYAASVRYNAVPAVIPILFLFFFDFVSIKRKAILLTMTVTVLFLIANYFFVYGFLRATKVYVFQSIMSHDLQAIYKATGENYFPEQYIGPTKLNELMQRFNPKSNAPTTTDQGNPWSSDFIVIKSLREQWLKAILAHPIAYLEHRWILFKSFLFDRDLEVPSVAPSSSTEPPAIVSAIVPPLYREGALAKIHNKMQAWFYRNSAILYEGATYYFVSMIIAGYAFFRRNCPAVAISLSSLIYFSTFFFAAPFAEFRYFYWSIWGTLVSLYLVWVETYTVKKMIV